MAYLPEGNAWVDDVYLIEDNDPCQGGDYGIDNRQGRAYASRTHYLKAHTGDVNGLLRPFYFMVDSDVTSPTYGALIEVGNSSDVPVPAFTVSSSGELEYDDTTLPPRYSRLMIIGDNLMAEIT